MIESGTKPLGCLAAFCWLALLCGCSSMEEPATQAVASAESALAAVKGPAATYAPAALRSLESQVAAMKAELLMGDYQSVITAGPKVTAALQDLNDVVRQEEGQVRTAATNAAEQWNSSGTGSVRQ